MKALPSKRPSRTNPPAEPRRRSVLALSHAALVRELEAQQAELELRNEELRRAQAELAAARDVFSDLYDFAPVGYFTVDEHGLIAAANLTGASMLGQERKCLPGRRFVSFVLPADRDLCQRHLLRSQQVAAAMHVELRLLGMAGQWFRGQLDCVRVAPAGDAPLVRVALTDVTQRSLSETHRRIACNAIDAREAERRCVARELHEDLGQRLGALKMELASLDAAIEAVARRCRIRAMLETLDGAIGTIRRIATDLHPLLLDDLGLNAAIDWFARDMAQRLGLKVRVHLDEDDLPTDERVSVAIYRMAQEALAHVALHTRSSCVDIHLEQRGGTVVLQVEGNGPERHAANAFAADSETTLALRDRAHMLGGELAFGGSGRAGARIAMRLSPARGPLAPNGPAASP